MIWKLPLQATRKCLECALYVFPEVRFVDEHSLSGDCWLLTSISVCASDFSRTDPGQLFTRPDMLRGVEQGGRAHILIKFQPLNKGPYSMRLFH